MGKHIQTGDLQQKGTNRVHGSGPQLENVYTKPTGAKKLNKKGLHQSMLINDDYYFFVDVRDGVAGDNVCLPTSAPIRRFVCQILLIAPSFESHSYNPLSFPYYWGGQNLL